MGIVTSTPLFDDIHVTNNHDQKSEEVQGETDVLLSTYSCYKLLELPRQLIVASSTTAITSTVTSFSSTQPTSTQPSSFSFLFSSSGSSNRAPILTASSCDEDEEVDSLGENEPKTSLLEDDDEHNENDEQRQERKQIQESTLTVHYSSCQDNLMCQEELYADTVCCGIVDTNVSLASSQHLQQQQQQQPKRPPRIFDLYETDSTLLIPMEEQDQDEQRYYPQEDVAESSSTSSRMTLPFRRCSRRFCTCCSTTSTTRQPFCNSSLHTATSSRHHQRQKQESLVGLSVLPLLSSNISDVSEYSNSSRLIQQQQQQQQQILQQPQPQHGTNRTRSGSFHRSSNHSVGMINKPPRLPVSPKRRKGTPSSKYAYPPADWCNSPNVFNTTTSTGSKSSALKTPNSNSLHQYRGRARSEDFIEGGNIFSSSVKNNHVPTFPNKGRSRSEDFVDSNENIFDSSYRTTLKALMSPSSPETVPCERKPRARSEDLVDVPGKSNTFASASPAPAAGASATAHSTAVSVALTKSPKPNYRRQRASSTPSGSTMVPLQASNSCSNSSFETAPKQQRSSSAVLLPNSPTSVMHHHFATEMPLALGGCLKTVDATTVAATTSTSVTTTTTGTTSAPSAVANYGNAPTSLISLAEFLESQGRYAEARTEYRRLLSTIQSQKQSSAPTMKADLYHHIAWTHYQESRYSAALCVVKHALEVLQLAHGCLTLDDTLVAICSSTDASITTTCQIADLMLTQARIHASLDDQQESKRLAKMALKVLMEKQNHNDVTSQIVFAKGLLVLGKTYSTADTSVVNNGNERAMQHYHQALQIFSYFQQHSHVAETIHLMGEASPASLANPTYGQALMIRYRQMQDFPQPQDDIATTLARLGWNALVLGQLDAALELSRQALERTVNPRNVASINYQIGLVYSQMGNSTEALRKWKKTLKMQQSIFRGEQHIDTARTCEVIATEYQRLGRYDKARGFLEGALEMYSQPEDLARMQSRLAQHFTLYEKDISRAKCAWSQASKIYKYNQIPMDEVGREAKKVVAVLKTMKRLSSISSSMQYSTTCP